MQFAVIVYLIWLVFVARRLFRLPMPRPTDVAIFSLFFYNVPLALAAVLPLGTLLEDYAVFLNAVAGEREVANKTLLLTMFASLALATGRTLGRGFSSHPRTFLAIPITHRFQRAAGSACLVALAAIGAGLSLFGIDSFFSGYATDSAAPGATSGTALIFFAYEVIGLCALLWYVCYQETRDRNRRLVVGIALTTIVGLTLVRGKRLELIIALAPLFLVVWSKLKVRQRMLAVIAIVLAISSWASFRQGAVPNPAAIAFNVFSEGLYAGHVTPGIVEALDSHNLSTEGGKRFWAALAAFIPRFVFPNKDEIIYQSLTEMSQFAPLGATSMLAEVYLQGKSIALSGFFFVVGLVGRRLELDELFPPQRVIFPHSVLYLLFVCSFIPHFRDGIIPAIKIPLQLVAVFTALVLFAAPRLRRIQTKKTASIPPTLSSG